MSASTPTLLTLPAELRNNIYRSLFESAALIGVHYEPHSNQGPEVIQFRLNKGVKVPINVFLSSQALYQEASSAFYLNNTFQFVRRYCGYRHNGRPLVKIPGIFFQRLGAQVVLVRKIVLDLSAFDECVDYHAPSKSS